VDEETGKPRRKSADMKRGFERRKKLIAQFIVEHPERYGGQTSGVVCWARSILRGLRQEPYEVQV
jgi:hypothetical protein